MPTIAETSQAKRLLCDHGGGGDDDGGNASPSGHKRQRVRFEFDDSIEILRSFVNEEAQQDHEEEDDDDDDEVDFLLSIGEDGDWDYTITITSAAAAPSAHEEEEEELQEAPEDPDDKSRDNTHLLYEELYTMPLSTSSIEEGSLYRVDSANSLGNNLKISLKAFDDGDSSSPSVAAAAAASPPSESNSSAAAPVPLITPPSSPRRVRALLCDGTTAEEATICEWPCNLAVDNAITSAMEECADPSLP